MGLLRAVGSMGLLRAVGSMDFLRGIWSMGLLWAVWSMGLLWAWYVSNVSIIYEVFMLLFYHSCVFYSHFIATLYHFLDLTYWPSAQCQLLFFACFLHHRKSISNGVQTPRKSIEFFYGLEDFHSAKEAHGGAPRGAQPTRARQAHLACPGGLCPPRWPPAPPLCSKNTPGRS